MSKVKDWLKQLWQAFTEPSLAEEELGERIKLARALRAKLEAEARRVGK